MYLRTLEIFLKICRVGPTKFLLASGLACQAALKKNKAILDLLTDIVMLLLILEKVVWGGMCHSICWYVKANNKYMKNYDKN